MKFELRTLFFDIIMAIVFVIESLFWFNVLNPSIYVKILVFAVCVVATCYFGCYRNHNYTNEAFINQGRLDIEKGRVVSNTDVLKQILPEKEMEN